MKGAFTRRRGSASQDSQENMSSQPEMSPSTADCGDYLTVPQVSSWLQVSGKSVSRWAKSDPTMPVLRIGRTVRFPRERLMRWLKAREQGAGRGKRSKEPLSSLANPIENMRDITP